MNWLKKKFWIKKVKQKKIWGQKSNVSINMILIWSINYITIFFFCTVDIRSSNSGEKKKQMDIKIWKKEWLFVLIYN